MQEPFSDSSGLALKKRRVAVWKAIVISGAYVVPDVLARDTSAEGVEAALCLLVKLGLGRVRYVAGYQHQVGLHVVAQMDGESVPGLPLVFGAEVQIADMGDTYRLHDPPARRTAQAGRAAAGRRGRL